MSDEPKDHLREIAAAEAQRFSMLRMQMLECHPFWGHLLLQMRLVPAPDLDALAATDCVRHIWYNPLHTRSLTLSQLGFLLAHEVGHSLFETLERARGRNPYLWNCATDYAINRVVSLIRKPGEPHASMYEPPSGRHPALGDLRPLMDRRFDGLIAEAIYERLVSEITAAIERVTIHLAGVDVTGVVPHGGFDVHLPLDLSEADQHVLRERLGLAVNAWRESAKRGDVPAGLERVVDQWGKPHVPWQRVLHRYVGEATTPDDFSLSRPNRRWLAEGFLVPGVVPRDEHDLIVAVDTSGSMSTAALAAIGAELASLAAIEPNVTVLVGDAAVNQVVPARDLRTFLGGLRLRGGGGTDHRPVFAWIESARRRPDVFIGLTDLHSAFPDRAPRFPVLWVVPKDHGRAPWGRVVEMEA